MLYQSAVFLMFSTHAHYVYYVHKNLVQQCIVIITLLLLLVLFLYIFNTWKLCVNLHIFHFPIKSYFYCILFYFILIIFFCIKSSESNQLTKVNLKTQKPDVYQSGKSYKSICKPANYTESLYLNMLTSG